MNNEYGNNVLDTMIKIPVKKPTELNQCGTLNTVFPPQKRPKWLSHGNNRQKKKVCCGKDGNSKDVPRQEVQNEGHSKKTKGEQE